MIYVQFSKARTERFARLREFTVYENCNLSQPSRGILAPEEISVHLRYSFFNRGLVGCLRVQRGQGANLGEVQVDQLARL